MSAQGASGGEGVLVHDDVHPRVAMQILRHSKIAITMEMYTEVVSSATREALRKLGDLEIRQSPHIRLYRSPSSARPG
jgi:hypothetical protein